MAEPVVESSVIHYDVSGHSYEELRADLTRQALRAIASNTPEKTYRGHTNYDIHWHYTYARTAASCAINKVEVKLNVTTIVPQLSPSLTISQELRERFERYTANLVKHEQGHADIGVTISRQIEQMLHHLPPENSCSLLGEKANAAGHALTAQAKQQNIDYDAATRHGATQGAKFQ